MANSRTKILIPMLVLCFLAVSAYGQAVLTLGSNPTRVRVEGLTEVVGLITLSNNTNAAQVIPGGTTVAIVFDGPITNGPGLSTAAVGLAPTSNVYTTGKTATDTSSTILGTGTATTLTQSGASLTLSISATYGNDGVGTCAAATVGATKLCLIAGGSLNIQGVRVAISGLPAGNINAQLTTVPANAITFPGGINSTVVGRAQATIGRVDVVSAATIGQCSIVSTPTASPIVAGTGFGATTVGAAFTGVKAIPNGFWVNVTEPTTFPTSFSAATSTGVLTTALAFDEAGITPGGAGAAYATGNFQGSALVPSPIVTTGVQFTVTFSSLPAGLTLLAANTLATGGATTPATAINSGIAAPNTVTMNVVSTSGTTLVQSVFATAANFSSIAASSGGGSITYEVAATSTASPTAVDTVSIPFLVSAPAGTAIPVGTIGGVQVSVAPLSSDTTTTKSTLRFGANSGVPSTPAVIGAITPCLTNLLFPFVSNNAKTTFNTGMAISNTASDATFGAKGATTGQTGGVTLFFFGISAPTGGTAGIALPIPAVSTGGTVATSGVIAPGEHTAFVLNDGTTKAIAPGFQGYVIALCAFQYAHGLATIFDNFGVGPANVGFSYLPLVLNGTVPGRVATGNNGATGSLGAGPEVLAH